MRHHIRLLPALGSLVWLLMAPPATQASVADPTGSWTGSLDAGTVVLRVVFHIDRADDGTLSATMDSPDQGATGIPVTSIHFADNHLTMEVASVGGSFEGTMSDDGLEIVGSWQQSGMSFPLVLARDETEEDERGPTQNMNLPDLSGTWQGTLDAGGATLHIVFNVSRAANGTLSATMDSPDQAAKGISVSNVRVEDGKLIFEVKAVGGHYEGTLDEAMQHTTGTWYQGSASAPLNLERGAEAPKANRPQTPGPPYPYDAEDVQFPNEPAGITLAGTLTLPPGDGPFPAVVLISGSGPQDRNETLFGHKPFLVLADHLTRRGIAVLRCDDRGVGQSTGSMAGATTYDFAGDVRAAVAFLKTQPRIDAAHVGLVGHSEGGVIAPLVAAGSDDVAFVVLLAGPGVDGAHLLYLQSELVNRANGATEPALKKLKALEQQAFTRMTQDPLPDDLSEQLGTLAAQAFDGMTVEERQSLHVTKEILSRQLQQEGASAWFRTFLALDPAVALREVTVPVLALIGAKDLQVPPAQNLPAIRAALERGGNTDYTVKEIPGLNHLFQTAGTGAPSEYASIEETLSPEALDEVTEWILKRVAM